MPKGMELSGVQTCLLSLVSRCSIVLGSSFDACRALLEQKRKDAPRQVGLLRLLSDSCHLTSESVLILIGNCKLWDADSLTRAVVEGTVKFAYLSFGSQEEMSRKITEYDCILPEINRLKRHDRIESFLSVIEDPGTVEWKGLRDLLLAEHEIAELRSRFPKSVRQAVEHAWSFHSLLQALSSSGLAELKNSTALFYNYGMSSHVLHQDADGVGMIWERNNRDSRRKDAVELAHGARLLSDLIAMSLIRHAMSQHVCGYPNGSSLPMYEGYRDLQDELGALLHDWTRIEYGQAESKCPE